MKIYFDQDGTLAKFHYVPLFVLYIWGYFLFLRPHRNILKAMKMLDASPDTEVYVLTSVLEDHPTAKQEKLRWLKRFAPFIPQERIIFVPCGCNKSDYLEVTGNDILVDDYGVNVAGWHGPYVKVSRDNNDMQKEVKNHPYCINPQMDPDSIVTTVLLAGLNETAN